jgi:hypothetical protein
MRGTESKGVVTPSPAPEIWNLESAICNLQSKIENRKSKISNVRRPLIQAHHIQSPQKALAPFRIRSTLRA